MKRFENAVGIARTVSSGFFAEMFSQLGIVKCQNTKTQGQKNDFVDLNVGEAVARGWEHDFEVAEVSVMVMVGENCYVDFRLYKDRITRVMKKPCDGRYQRVFLADYTPDVASKAYLTFTVLDAIKFTKNEFGAPSTPEAAVEEPTVKCTDAPKKAVWSVPKERCESNEPGLSKVSKGNVVFAGKSTVTPKGKSPYTTFTVILKTATGAEIENSGVELENLFLAGRFSVGDDVVLEKKVETFDQEIGGVKKKGTRNSYKVNVL